MSDLETNIERSTHYDTSKGGYDISGWHLRQALRGLLERIEALEAELKTLKESKPS